jgi:reactive intermediate/imine deaminase
MNRTQINPWTWQDALGFSQCWRVDAPASLLFLAGQAPLTPEGRLVDGGFEEQVRQVLENMRVVLEQAGAGFDAVVKLTVYLTDMTRLRDFGRIRAEYMNTPHPASTAVGVTALALPGMMVEVEAVAVL